MVLGPLTEAPCKQGWAGVVRTPTPTPTSALGWTSSEVGFLDLRGTPTLPAEPLTTQGSGAESGQPEVNPETALCPSEG